jgi:hypothetical protein
LAHNPKVDDVKATEAQLREGAVAKALLERMTEAAVIRINEMSQDEMKQRGQALKDSGAWRRRDPGPGLDPTRSPSQGLPRGRRKAIYQPSTGNRAGLTTVHESSNRGRDPYQ